jgi:hypothetical protein
MAPKAPWDDPTLTRTEKSRLYTARLEEVFAERHHEFRVQGGFFSAIGSLGVTYTYAPTHSLLLESGIGVGWTGLQLEVMPKLSFGSAKNRVLLGAGPSVGFSTGPAAENDDGPVYWLNLEVGWQRFFPNGVAFLLAFGTTTIVAGREDVYDCRNFILSCHPEDYKFYDDRGITVPTVRAGVGYWF